MAWQLTPASAFPRAARATHEFACSLWIDGLPGVSAEMGIEERGARRRPKMDRRDHRLHATEIPAVVISHINALLNGEKGITCPSPPSDPSRCSARGRRRLAGAE